MAPDAAALPTRFDRWRNRLAVRVFDWIATPALVEQVNRDVGDAAMWRGHVRRRALGFIVCEEAANEVR